jgi:hypothetical protein
MPNRTYRMTRGEEASTVRRSKAPVYRITGTRRGLDEDISARQRRYLISMGIRTACFILAIVTSGWLRWVFVVGALVLPYLSVVMANAGRDRNLDLPDVPPESHPALDPPKDQPPQ